MKKIRQASRRHPRVLVAAGLLALVVVLSVTAVALAASVSPIYHSGNTPHTCDLKIDPPNSGTYAIPTCLGQYVQVTFSGSKKQVSFTSDVPVTKVLVKGGDAYYEYNYGSSGVSSDSGLRAPDNDGGQQPQISHVCFFFASCQTTTTTAPPSTTTTTQEETTTTTTEEETTTTTTQEETTTTTTQEETTTTVGGETTVPTQPQTTVTSAPPVTGGETTVPQTTSTAPPVTGGETTTPPASQVQAGGGGTAGMGGGMWALIVLAASLGIGLTASTLKARLGARQ